MRYPSAWWKHQALAALKDHWLTALLIALVVNLPTLLVQGIATVTGNDLTGRIQTALLAAVTESGTVDTEKMLTGIAAIQENSGVWAMQGLNVLAWLLTPCLTLGMTAWLLGRLRKQEDPGFTAVFSRVRLFWKAIGLRLYVMLRVILFMLPGVALSAASLLPLWLSDTSSRIAVLSAANTSMGLMSAASIATVALGVVGALRYALADMVQADHTGLGPIRSAKESKRLTQGKRGQIFLLYLSLLFWYFLELMGANLLIASLGSIPSLMFQLLASLAISVYLSGSVCAFYLGCRREETPGAGETEEEGDGVTAKEEEYWIENDEK